MSQRIRVLDGALAVWALLWVLAAVVVYQQVRQLEEIGETAVTAGAGLSDTSRGLSGLSDGLRETGRALDALNEIPFLDSIDNELDRTADEVDDIAAQLRSAARDARVSGAQARDSARTLALVLALAVGLAPTLPILVLYLLLRPLLAHQLAPRA